MGCALIQGCSNGGIGRHEGLKILWPVMAVRVQVPLRVQMKSLVNHTVYKRFFLFLLLMFLVAAFVRLMWHYVAFL